ncbi:DUF2497 domain-containing protein [Acetobacter thailandicus]|uniref:DUF2497 domain-containing protein n=1 Tax=Acetobacter thailandicus TaxID=1502842 RepID=A0ABT3QG22_9PROT|nr:DUF2497 domain-containing protein [Acetobacter thailandicus]MCX2564237.1 DUF2497 domain-containing protein [Acetobacter thailandicus]
MTSSPSDETKTPIEDILASIRNKLKEERPEFLESPLLHTGLYEDEEDLVLTPELTAEKEEGDLVLTPELTAEKEEGDLVLTPELTAEKEEGDLILTPELTAEKEEGDLILTPELTAEKEEGDLILTPELTAEKEEDLVLTPELTAEKEEDLVLTPELTAEKEEGDLILTPELTAEKEEEDSAASLASVIREEFAKLSPEEAKPVNSEPTEKQTEELRLIDEAPPSIREILLQLYTEKASLSGLESKNTIENEVHEDRAHTSSNADERDHNIAQDYNVVRDDTGQNSLPENAVQENTASALSVSKPRNVSKGGEEEGDYGSLSIPLNVETIADTDSSFAILQKTLQEKYLHEHEERRVAVNNQGSLTIEDIVRQEVRVMLKKWLDANLAGIVQDSVKKEVERLSQRNP